MKSNFTIGKRVGLLSASLVVCCLAVAITALISFGSVDRSTVQLTTDAMPGAEAISNIASAIYQFRGDAWRHIASSNADQMAAVESQMGQIKSLISKEMSAYGATIHLADDRANFNELSQAIDQYVSAWQNDVIALSRQSRNQDAYNAYLASADPAYKRLDETVAKMVKWNTDYGKRSAAELSGTVSSTRVLTYILLFGSLLAGVLLSVLILRGINRALQHVVTELSNSADQVASAASQIASSSQSMAQGSSEQAASLEETSASTEEVNSMAGRNTENSRFATELVVQSQQKFLEVNQSLQEMVGAMGEIESSSNRISKIIKVIDEIAFQTNILALNAAVEAARAGESGMGFAVVADEVRNLAQRCAQAARDTTGLIEESIAKSSDGKVKVDRVAGAIHAVTSESARVKDLVEEVNQGSQEQARGIGQISQAIAQMGQVTQTTAANAEESASAAEELSAQSEALRGVVQELIAMVGGAGSGPEEGKARTRHAELRA